jgi:tetratricopeptide (TPR) repeat protein
MKKPINKWVVVGAFLALLGGGVWYWQTLRSTNGDAGAALTRIAASVTRQRGRPYFKTRFQDESQFIVELIVADIGEMAIFAKSHVAPGKSVAVEATETKDSQTGQPVYEIKVRLGQGGEVRSLLRMDGPIWSPEAYSEITGQILKSVGTPESTLSRIDGANVLQSLLQLSAINIEKANIALSLALSGDFSNPTLHEESAVLLGAFALRDNAGDFHEIRSPLCRMTAHLAIASAFNGGRGVGPNGLVADALLSALMNNQADAIAKTEKLKNGSPELAAWARVVRARSSHDFRELGAFAQRSMAEDTEYFRAMCLSERADPAWESLSRASKVDKMSVFRIINTTGSSVQLGHVMLDGSLPLELAEVATIYRLARGGTLDTNNIARILNQSPERCFSENASGTPGVRVIGWGQWAMFFQHHLCNAVLQNFDFQMRQWGVPEEAQAFSTQCNQQFGRLWLFPFVRRMTCTDVPSYKKSVEDIIQTTRAMPHLAPAGTWSYLGSHPDFADRLEPDDLRMISEWHKHNPPPGTAYDAGARVNHISFARRHGRVQALEDLRRMAPYDINIIHKYFAVKYNGKQTPEQMDEAMHPLMDFDFEVLRELGVGYSGQPGRYEDLMSRAAELNAVAYFWMGRYFADRHDREKAADYFEKGSMFCTDDLWTSEYAQWLIDYYLEHGQVQKAKKLAEKAGDTYSETGLQVQALFLERQQHYNEALKVYRAIEERYGSSEELLGFYKRYKDKTGKADFDAAINAAASTEFPSGIEHVSIKDLHGPPGDGCYVSAANEFTAQAGLNAGAVIVALDGIRIRNFAQYAFVRGTSTNAALDLIVWQDNQYRRLRANPPNHRFGVDFPDYHPN